MMLQSTNTLLPSGVFVWDPVSNKPVPFTLNGANAPDQLVFQGTQYQPDLCRTFEQHRRQAPFQTLELQQQLTQKQTRPTASNTNTNTTAAAALSLFPSQSASLGLALPPSTTAAAATTTAQPLPCLLHFAPHPTEPLQTGPAYGGLLHSIATPKAAPHPHPHLHPHSTGAIATTTATTSPSNCTAHKGVDAALVEWEEKRARKRSRVWEAQEDECLAQAAAQYGGKMWKRIGQRVQQLLPLLLHAPAQGSAPGDSNSNSNSNSSSSDSEDNMNEKENEKEKEKEAATPSLSPRTADQCCQRWTRVLAPRMARVRWSDRRDAQLLSAAQTLASSLLASSSSSSSSSSLQADHIRIDTRSLATIDTHLFDRLDWHTLAAQMAFHDATPAACRYRFFHLRRLAKDALRTQRRLLASASASAPSAPAPAPLVLSGADSSVPQKHHPASPVAPLSASSCASSASLSPSSSSQTPLPFVSSRAHMLRIEALLN